jgi:hypothetical protein
MSSSDESPVDVLITEIKYECAALLNLGDRYQPDPRHALVKTFDELHEIAEGDWRCNETGPRNDLYRQRVYIADHDGIYFAATDDGLKFTMNPHLGMSWYYEYWLPREYNICQTMIDMLEAGRRVLPHQKKRTHAELLKAERKRIGFLIEHQQRVDRLLKNGDSPIP